MAVIGLKLLSIYAGLLQMPKVTTHALSFQLNTLIHGHTSITFLYKNKGGRTMPFISIHLGIASPVQEVLFMVLPMSISIRNMQSGVNLNYPMIICTDQ